MDPIATLQGDNIGFSVFAMTFLLIGLSLQDEILYFTYKCSKKAEKIKAKYAEKGYVNAQVSYELEKNENLRVVYVKLIIDEGNRMRVQDVTLESEGEVELPTEKIIKKLEKEYK